MANHKIVRLGIIGLGPRARHLMTLYKTHPLCKITALCDRARPVVENAARLLGMPDVKCHTSYEEMLAATPVDALLIAINPDVQADLACDAMQRGLHVTTEVPVAYTIEQCRNLVRTVEKTGVKYQPAEQTRYWSFIRQWRDMAQRGEFGHIIFAEGEYLHYEDNWDFYVDPSTGELFRGAATPPPDRQTQPTWRYRSFFHPIYYLPHTLSPLLSIIQDRVVAVSCMGTRPGSYTTNNYPGRDFEVALMHTSQDTILRVAAGFTSPHGLRGDTYAHWYQVKGTQCTVESARSPEDKPRLWRADTKQWQEMDWTCEDKNADEFIRQSGHGGVDWWPVDSFLRAIAENKPVAMDVYTAVETAAPAILAAASSEQGGALLPVPDFRPVSKNRYSDPFQ